MIEFYNLDAIISVGYATFRVQQDRRFESDFEKEVKRIAENKRKESGQ